MPQESISIDRGLKREVMRFKTKNVSFSNLCRDLIEEGVFLRKTSLEKLMADFAAEQISVFMGTVLEESDFLGDKGQKISAFIVKRADAAKFLEDVRKKMFPETEEPII